MKDALVRHQEEVYRAKKDAAYGVYFSLRVIVHPPVGRLFADWEDGAVKDAPNTATHKAIRAHLIRGSLFHIASLNLRVKISDKISEVQKLTTHTRYR